LGVRITPAACDPGSHRGRGSSARRAGRSQLAIAAALHEPPVSAASQLQAAPQEQAAGLAGANAAPADWQPQLQPLPGQLAHWQVEAKSEVMAVPFVG
jgi:hypothetical protein